jgi:hypothetical protein
LTTAECATFIAPGERFRGLDLAGAMSIQRGGFSVLVLCVLFAWGCLPTKSKSGGGDAALGAGGGLGADGAMLTGGVMGAGGDMGSGDIGPVGDLGPGGMPPQTLCGEVNPEAQCRTAARRAGTCYADVCPNNELPPGTVGQAVRDRCDDALVRRICEARGACADLVEILGAVFPAFLEACRSADPCTNIQCGEGGNCVDGVCICEPGWRGPFCDVREEDGLHCVQLDGCVAACGSGDPACFNACLARGRPRSAQLLRDVVDCAGRAGCEDEACVLAACRDELRRCQLDAEGGDAQCGAALACLIGCGADQACQDGCFFGATQAAQDRLASHLQCVIDAGCEAIEMCADCAQSETECRDDGGR